MKNEEKEPSLKKSKSSLRVLNDLLIVKEDPYDKYEGSVLIPDAYDAYFAKIPGSGIVVAVGPATKYRLKIGDHVIFGKHAGMRFEHEGYKVQLIREYDILGVIND